MSLKDYAVKRDKFEPRPDVGFGFPCCACRHMDKPSGKDPCRTCDHNVNAVMDESVGAAGGGGGGN